MESCAHRGSRLLLSLLMLLAACVCPGCGERTCQAAPDGFLNVHLVPHTHNDAGWLKTVDQYYYGGNNSIQHAGVQYILDSVISQLVADPKRRFIYVESAFFWRWWREQNESMQREVVQLIKEGRLEFINGGWTMNDEGATHYSAIIDQMTLGLQFLQNTFGEFGRPRVAWHIDPFGHSREQASLFAQMGFDGFFFGRLDYQDKTNREKTQQMEMIWRASDDLEIPNADLFTVVLPNGYNPPDGFCWDQLCNDMPIMDNPQLEDYNANVVLTNFLKAVNTQSSKYRSNHIIMTMGSDFQYENAIPWYKNMDKLINLVNAQQVNGSKVNVFYSTPSCYLSALNKANLSWPMKMDDFFPYADGAHMFWTGYFTSRPAFKGYERLSNNFLQVCNQLEALTGSAATHGAYGTSSLELRQAMALAQHHDAVTGTAKQHVNDDYTLRLFRGWNACQVVVSNALSKLTGTKENFVFCNLLNISVCPLTETSKSFSLVIYNPLGRAVTQYVRLPVNGAVYEVKGPSGESIPSEVVPVSVFTKKVCRNQASAERELIFPAQIPPIGFSKFTVEMVSAQERFFHTKIKSMPSVIGNKFYRVEFDPKTGLISTIHNLEKMISLPIKQSFYWYNASIGNQDSSQTSGAYIFRPNQSEPRPISQTVRSYLVKNALVQEVHQSFSSWCSQVVRLYSDQKYLELEWTVGPIPVGDGEGKEVISRFDTNLKTEGLFYTDANGRQILRRRRNSRETWAFQQTEIVAGNYYPVNSRIYIKDQNIQLTVLTDRSQGGSSLEDGSVELMIHRRLLYDDYRGVEEPLDEPGQCGKGLVIRGKHRLVLDTPEASADVHRALALQQYLAPQMVFSTGQGAPYWEDQGPTNQFSALRASLPDNLHLLTLAQHESNKILLRLEHPFQRHESGNCSQPVTVNIQELFSSLSLYDFKEVTLAANLPKDKMKRMQWVAQKDSVTRSDHSSLDLDPTNVTLKPMEIRTFVATVKYKRS